MRSFFYLTLLTLFFHKAFCSTAVGDVTFTVVGVFTDKTATTDKKFWFITMEPQSPGSYVSFSNPIPGPSGAWSAVSEIGQNQFRFFPTDDLANSLNPQGSSSFNSEGYADSPNLHLTGLSVEIVPINGIAQSATIPASAFPEISF